MSSQNQVNATNSMSNLIAQRETGHATGEARVAKVHQVQDTVGTAQQQAQKGKEEATTTSLKAQLPAPTKGFSGLTGDDGETQGQTMGLLAIIGEVMALQAKSNSNFWKTQWQQASQSMMMQVKFAPIIGNAVKAQYQAQADATKAQADESKWNGIIFAGSFVMCVGGAGIAVGKEAMDATNSVAEDELGNAENEGEAAAGAGDLNNAGDDLEAENADNQVQQGQVEEQVNNENASRWKNTLKWLKDGASKGGKRFSEWMGKSVQGAQLAQMQAQASTNLVSNKYQNIQAQQQGIQGQQASLDKMSEQYAQFYGQNFSRNEDLRNSAQQNIDTAMNTLSQAANAITSTVTQMFA